MSNFFASFEDGLGPVDDLYLSEEELSESVIDASFEADSAEIDKLVAEAEAADTEGDNGGKAAELIDKIEEVVADAKDDEGEGVDATAAEAIGIGVEAIMMLAGSRNSVTVRDATSFEAFSSVNTRGAATVVAEEGIKEMAKKVWDVIVASYKKVVSVISKIISKIIGFFTGTEKRIKKLREQVNEIDTKKYTADNDKVEFPMAKGLVGVFKGEPDENASLKDIEKAVKSIDFLDAMMSSTGNTLTALTTFIGDYGSSEPTKKKDVFENYAKTVIVPVVDKIGHVKKLKGVESNKHTMFIGPFANFKFIKVEVNKEDKTLSFSSVQQPNKEEKDMKADTLTPSDMFQVLDIAGKLVSNIKVLEGYKASGNKIIKGIEKAAKFQQDLAVKYKVAKKDNDSKDIKEGDIVSSSEKEGSKQIIMLLRQSNSFYSKLTTNAISTLNYAVNGALRYVDLSIDEYDKKKKNKKKKDKKDDKGNKDDD